MSDLPDWRNTDPRTVEPEFCWWLHELTAQGLHSKPDIAIALAIRSREIARLRAELDSERRKLDAIEQAAALYVSRENAGLLLKAIDSARGIAAAEKADPPQEGV